MSPRKTNRKIFDGEENEGTSVEDFEEENKKKSGGSIVIENTGMGVIQLAPKSGQKTGKPLPPGESDISVKDWEEAKKNPAVKMYIARDLLILRSDLEKARPILETLDSFNLMKAKDYVTREKDKKQVERWLKGTTDQQKKQLCEVALENWS